MVHGADGPTISIESNATRLGGDDRFDRDDETVREDVVSEGIGEVGNRGRFVNSAADAMPPSSRTTWNPHRRTSRSTPRPKSLVRLPARAATSAWRKARSAQRARPRDTWLDGGKTEGDESVAGDVTLSATEADEGAEVVGNSASENRPHRIADPTHG